MYIAYYSGESDTGRAVLQQRILPDRELDRQMKVTEGKLPSGVEPVRALHGATRMPKSGDRDSNAMSRLRCRSKRSREDQTPHGGVTVGHRPNRRPKVTGRSKFPTTTAPDKHLGNPTRLPSRALTSFVCVDYVLFVRKASAKSEQYQSLEHLG